MNIEHRTLALLMQGRAVLIVSLSVASGWTTWNGLKLFIDWPIALGLTAAVQTILVIATYQLSKMYVAASSRRYLAVALGLFSAFCVSVFFSYFTFYGHSEGDRVAQRKFEKTRASIEDYVTQVVNARAKFLGDLSDTVTRLNREAQDALEGKLAGVPPGVGPIYLSLKKLSQEADEKLQSESTSVELGKRVEALRKVLTMLSAASTVPDDALYKELRNRLVDVESASQNWQITRGGVGRIVTPSLPPRKDYESVRPSLADMSQFSPLAFSLAVLVDLFTVMLTWWLETVPFGTLPASLVPSAFEAIQEFSEWGLNGNGQCEFRLTRSDEERYNGYNDSNRLFWTAFLLSLGLLRRVDWDHCEYTPRLLSVFSSLMCSRKGGNHGDIGTSPRATAARA